MVLLIRVLKGNESFARLNVGEMYVRIATDCHYQNIYYKFPGGKGYCILTKNGKITNYTD